MLCRRATARGAIAGWLVGFALSLLVSFATSVSFLWHALIGCVATLMIGWPVSLFLRPPEKANGSGVVVEQTSAD